MNIFLKWIIKMNEIFNCASHSTMLRNFCLSLCLVLISNTRPAANTETVSICFSSLFTLQSCVDRNNNNKVRLDSSWHRNYFNWLCLLWRWKAWCLLHVLLIPSSILFTSFHPPSSPFLPPFLPSSNLLVSVSVSCHTHSTWRHSMYTQISHTQWRHIQSIHTHPHWKHTHTKRVHGLAVSCIFPHLIIM